MSVKIQSNYFQNVFLRMDGEGVDNGPGGTVNCQWGAYSHEEFNLLAQQDGTFAIESVKFPGVYLRMDCDNNQVNCQTSIGPYEKFLIIKHCDGTYVIASNYFSGKYLRMDGNGVNKLTGKGSGTVNYQTSAGPYEKFKIA
jgi:hypothetical protein